MKLLESTENKITKDKKGKITEITHLEITEVVSVHCNIMIISKIQEFCIHLFQINHSVGY